MKLSCVLRDKKEYPVHISALKLTLNHGLKIETVHSAISFSQDAWLKPYIDRNTNLRMKAANDFEKDYYKLLNNSFYGKTMENVRNHRDIRLVTNSKKGSILASEPNYYSTKCISEDLLIMEMKLRDLYMNKPLYLGQAILDISKMLMYKFWYEYLKPKYGDEVKLCYMDTNSFITYVETDDFYKDISNDVDKWFDTSNFSKNIDTPLEKGKNKKVIGKFKDELGGLIMSEFCAHRPKTYAFLIDGINDYEKHGIINKKAKGTKKCVIQNQITFNDYDNVLFNGVKVLRSQYTFRSRFHEIHTEKINKIALSSNYDKRIQCDDKITMYPYGYYDIDENNANTNVITKIIIDTNVNSKIIDDTNVNTKIIEDTNVNTEIIEYNNVNNESIDDTNVNIETNDVVNILEMMHDIAISYFNTRNQINILKKEIKANKERVKVNNEKNHCIVNNLHNLNNKINSHKKYAGVIENKSIYFRNELNKLKKDTQDYLESVKANKENKLAIKKIIRSNKKCIWDNMRKLYDIEREIRKHTLINVKNLVDTMNKGIGEINSDSSDINNNVRSNKKALLGSKRILKNYCLKNKMQGIIMFLVKSYVILWNIKWKKLKKSLMILKSLLNLIEKIRIN